MFEEILQTEWILKKVRANNYYAQNLYAAMCNMRWQKLDIIPILKDEYWSCSWRSAGGKIAEILQHGDYMDWYCSGMGGLQVFDDESPEDVEAQFQLKRYVPEGTVTEEIREDLKLLGWVASEWPKD